MVREELVMVIGIFLGGWGQIIIKSLVLRNNSRAFVVTFNPRLVRFNEREPVHSVRGQADLSFCNKSLVAN